jgi:hypothetical protein
LFGLIRCNEDIDVLAKESPLVAINEKSTYIRKPRVRRLRYQGTDVLKAVLRAEVVFD